MRIKGVNLGCWLLMEGYILHSRNIAESQFKKGFLKVNGKTELDKFEKIYRDTFITERDFRNVKSMGANSVRIPFNHKLIEKTPFIYEESGLMYIENALNWAKINGIKVILDLHAAPGSQNCDWHGDSSGKAMFWEDKKYRERTTLLWEVIAERFKDHPALLGYDLLNEPVMGNKSIDILKSFYRDTVKRIRRFDTKSTIFLEGSLWSQKIDFLKDLIDDNISISIHTYFPLSFTFNFEPLSCFPGKLEGKLWNKNTVRKYLEPYYKFSQKNKVGIYVGEFGINWRGGYFGEIEWLDSMLSVYDEFGFGYTYWTYKAVANHVFPDGIYQYLPNNKYVRREGPVYGFETYADGWKKEQNRIVSIWDTKNYTPNKKIIETLKKHFK